MWSDIAESRYTYLVDTLNIYAAINIDVIIYHFISTAKESLCFMV